MDNIIKKYDNQGISFKVDPTTGETKIRIDEVAKFCGWTQIKNNKEYVKYERINKHLKELNSPLVGKGDYIPELIFYALIGKANNERATKFMLWVGQILMQLRHKGVVILDNAQDQAIEFEKKYGKYRIRKTFRSSEDILKDYKEFKVLEKQEKKKGRINNIERVKLYSIIANTLEKKINDNVLNLKASKIINIQEIISDIKSNIVKLSNKKNGGEKAYLTKKFNKAAEYIDYLEPSLKEFHTINVHGFSVNAMYTIKDNKKIKSNAYKKWISELPKVKVYNLDPNKQYVIYLYFESIKEIDVDNMSKSIVDQISSIHGIDDNDITAKVIKKIKTVDSFNKGKIHYCIKERI